MAGAVQAGFPGRGTALGARRSWISDVPNQRMTWKRSGTCCARGRYWSMRPCKGGPVGCHYLHAPSPGGALIPEEAGLSVRYHRHILVAPAEGSLIHQRHSTRPSPPPGPLPLRRRFYQTHDDAPTHPRPVGFPSNSACPSTCAPPHSRTQTAAAPKSAPSPAPGSGDPAPAGNPLSS